MTPKFRARATRFGRYQTFPIVDDHGNKYVPYGHQRFMQVLDMGDTVFLGRRINNHHGTLAEWELWEMRVERDPFFTRYWVSKTWYTGNRKLFLRADK
jgi:hypothetical protein